MHLLPSCIAIAFLSVATSLEAQIPIQHLTGSGFANGNPSGASLTYLQRMPADQMAGATSIGGFTTTLQVQSSATAQQFFYELRGNDATVATGAPDMVAPPLASIGPFSFPASPIPLALRFTMTFATPVLFAPRLRSPADDLYAAVVLPAVVPGNTALLMHLGQERPRASAIGYSGVAGAAGLSWWCVTGSVAALPFTSFAPPFQGDCAFDLGNLYRHDVCQPFVQTGIGSPGFGYAGLFPDTAAGQAIGWRVMTRKPAGSLVALGVATSLLSAPAPLAGMSGLLCVQPASMIVLGMTSTVPGAWPAGTSVAMFGPYPVVVTATIDLFAQAVALDPVLGLIELTTTCRTNL